ncbi:NAD(P)H-binding protein [Nannocystis radixulma]|uniref:NAD(P)H-binding protein n=1 Tax=Nannocystis radixulma TaxID=2995305 RepID=A0ABT5AXR2_9BACT|nr:NAD(P)H-binding protein [Nannocystis radixulma]MDC0666630.1 NAD(P)H-binding protein [Nannocystis radixulma]
MPPQDRVLVIGGTGRTGRHVVNTLREEGRPLRVLVRDRARAEELLGSGLDLVIGDALDLDLAPAFAGVAHVISTLGSRDVHGGGLRTVDLPATVRLVAAAKAADVARFVLCSTIGAVPTPGVPPHMLEWFAPKGEAEAALRDSGVPFAIVRPGGLADGPTTDPRMIDCRHVARALVDATTRADALDATFELSNARLQQPGADPTLGLHVTARRPAPVPA